MTPDLEALLDEWAMWMRSASLSPRTIEQRLLVVRHLAGITDPMTCDWRPLGEWLGTPHFSRQTRSVYQGCLKSWFRWLLLMDYRTDDPTVKLPKVRIQPGTPRPISTDALYAVLQKVNRSRTRTMILLAAYQGLRVHEIAKIRGEDIGPDTLHVLGKGAKGAYLPLHPLIAVEALRYPTIGWWFPSYKYEGPVDREAVGHAIGNTLRRAGINATAHQLRHWYGTEALKAADGNLRVAQELLRHTNIATTAIYTKVDPEQRRSAVLGLPTAAGQL